MTSFLALRASVCAYLWCLIPSVCYIGFPNSDLLFQFQRILLEAFPLAGGPQFETWSTLILFCSHLSGLNFAQMLPYEFELVSSRL